MNPKEHEIHETQGPDGVTTFQCVCGWTFRCRNAEWFFYQQGYHAAMGHLGSYILKDSKV